MGRKNPFYADVMSMSEGVTGSCNLVVVRLPNNEKIRFVVDCGMFQEREYDDLNVDLPFNPDKIDFALVTHVHVDHVGRLPYMVKKGFRNPIYATKDTCEFMSPALRNSAKILNSLAKRKHTKALYSKEDVEETVNLMCECEKNKIISINEYIKVVFCDNVHIKGAASIYIQFSYPGEENFYIMFSGDYNNKNMFFDMEPILPEILKKPITVVTESTYGDMDSIEKHECFNKNVRECIENKGIVIAPVFSLGRAQEMLYVLKHMQDNGELSKDIPIYLDGNLAILYTQMYLKDRDGIKEGMQDFLPENFTYVTYNIRNEILSDKKSSKIILTTSGMGSYGPAQTYIPHFISQKNVLIQFTGYTAEGTLGNRLKNAKNGEVVEIGGLMVKKRAKVEYTTEYSAHAKADELIEFLKKFEDLKLVLIEHGEPETKKTFAERVIDEIDPKQVGILGRKYFFRINRYGLVKTLSTKFE